MLGTHTAGRAALAASILLVGIVAVASANLLVNGSFESGPNPGALLPLATGSTAMPGWTVTRAGVDYAGSAWTAAQGARSVALNGPGPGGIAQTIATLPNARYSVRFYLAGDPETLPDIKQMSVTAAGQTANFTADITGMWAWDPGWNPNVWSFKANGFNTTIEFYSTMTGTTGATIDSVSVELTSTADAESAVPAGVALAPISPNPAHGTSRVRFALPVTARATVRVFDVTGRVVATLADGMLGAGEHECAWDGRVQGAIAPPGLYRVVLDAAGRRESRNLVLVR